MKIRGEYSGSLRGTGCSTSMILRTGRFLHYRCYDGNGNKEHSFPSIVEYGDNSLLLAIDGGIQRFNITTHRATDFLAEIGFPDSLKGGSIHVAAARLGGGDLYLEQPDPIERDAIRRKPIVSSRSSCRISSPCSRTPIVISGLAHDSRESRHSTPPSIARCRSFTEDPNTTIPMDMQRTGTG